VLFSEKGSKSLYQPIRHLAKLSGIFVNAGQGYFTGIQQFVCRIITLVLKRNSYTLRQFLYCCNYGKLIVVVSRLAVVNAEIYHRQKNSAFLNLFIAKAKLADSFHAAH